ncbi:hypothetical protein GCM10008955_04880 [Deinococcus malanensis]|uniref:Uncharacterized protein n=1 Tax=Deinococcus malanensis TaxID=1706855 RepID=A0ABQ2EJY4_9DEIO|nr:hypothetical protein GCM10008955_04880 [Deinococcus malanensis]
MLTLALGVGWTAGQAQTAEPGSQMLDAVRQAVAALPLVPSEGSLLAWARKEGLGWDALQNLFELQVLDPANHFLEWRGLHSESGMFTTVRAALYAKTSREGLLVLNREWCRLDRCTARTTFGWVGPKGWRVTSEAAVIPLLRDADFYSGPAYSCLKGVSLGVSYLPARFGAGLTAVAVPPPEAVNVCRAAGVDPSLVTRPMQLSWHASAGKFRRVP